MDVCFEISDRDYEELGPWPLQLGVEARALLYAFRDHSPAQHGGRLLLPDLALAPTATPFGLRRIAPPLVAFCGMIAALRTLRQEARGERREETVLRLECGVPLTLVLRTRRWDNVDVAPVTAPRGLEAWQAARPPRVADVLSGVVALQELAFAVGDVSSFSLLDEGAPDAPVEGLVTRLEQLDLDPGSETFGALRDLQVLPETNFWPHRYFVTLRV